MDIPFPIDPRLLDPRRIARAMDDIHTLSTVGVKALDDLHAVAEIARELNERMEATQTLMRESIDLLTQISRIDAHVAQLLGTVEDVGKALPTARELIDSVQVLNAAAATLAAATEPLQGATERLWSLTGLPGAGGSKGTR